MFDFHAAKAIDKAIEIKAKAEGGGEGLCQGDYKIDNTDSSLHYSHLK